VCHHDSMTDPTGKSSASSSGVPGPRVSGVTVPVVWNVPTGPPPLVNHFLLGTQPDADGGPGEIAVHVGYAALPLRSPGAGEKITAIPVTTVASFTLTRHRAEQLVGFLNRQIEHWDKANAQVRGSNGEA
jgi:hypothetical protein